MVRERSRWFERRQTRWGVEPHRVAEARGECHRSRASFQMHACIDSSAAAAARQMRGSHGFHTQGTCGSHRRTSRARECGHFGAGLVLWLQELEESEASVHAVLAVLLHMRNSDHLVIL